MVRMMAWMTARMPLSLEAARSGRSALLQQQGGRLMGNAGGIGVLAAVAVRSAQGLGFGQGQEQEGWEKGRQLNSCNM